MSSPEANWNRVWERSKQTGSYSYIHSRLERSMDKVGYFISNGVLFQDGDRVLEAGCGDGLVLLSLLRLFEIQGHGLDISVSAKERAEELMEAEGKRFSFDIGDILAMPYPDDHFDKIVCLGVIEHFLDPTQSLAEVYRVLKPGGQVIMMTPNKKSLGVLDRKLKEWLGTWPFGYQTEYSPKELERLMTAQEFKILKREGLLRRRLPNDNRTVRVIGNFDRMMNLFVDDWGFFSYVFATK